MNTQQIQLDPLQMSMPLGWTWQPQPLRAAAAWFVPGGDVKLLFDLFARVPQYAEKSRLLPLPASAVDASPAGILVIGALQAAHVPSRAQPFGLVAKKLYLPVNMALSPPVTDAELLALLPFDIAVLHPTIGLVGCRTSDLHNWADLLAPLHTSSADWSAAQPGLAPARRLASVEIEDPPDAENILQSGQDDIGLSPTDELPPGDDESAGDGAKQAGRKLGKSLLQGMSWLTSSQGGANKQEWIRQLNAWSNNKLGSLNDAISRARNRELSRLVNMFERDPENALRYALPLSSINAGRGRARPTGRLRGRDTNFNLARLGGGMPSDPWHVPWDVHQRLRSLYTEAANRELKLGRHRRAAYIFAELLGDIDAAANALKQGSHYREAAVLYRDRLNRPTQAAECLKQGGLLTDAIKLYREQHMFSEAGDLWARLNRHDEAASCYREAVEAALRAYDRLTAARLLEDKLHAPDEALDILARGWPHASQAGACLSAQFKLLGQLGRHKQTQTLITRLRQDEHSLERTLAKSKVLVDVALQYPDTAARRYAADSVRSLAGKHLAGSAPATADAFVQMLTRLRPEDRLLARDGSRYLAKHTNATPLLDSLTQNKTQRIERLDEFQLVNDVIWTRAATGNGEFWIGGFERERGHTVVMRVAWNGETDRHQWRFPVPVAAGLILEPRNDGNGFVLAALSSEAPELPVVRFERTSTFSNIADAGMPDWLTGPLIGAGWGASDTLWVVRVDEATSLLSLSGYAPDGRLVETASLPGSLSPSFAESSTAVRIAARGRSLFVLLPDRLIAVQNETHLGESHVALPAGRARDIAISPRHSQPLLAVTQGEGAMLLRCDDLSDRPVGFAPDLIDAAAAFTRLGSLVVAGRHGSGSLGHVYMIRDDRPIKFEDFKAPTDVVAIVAGPGPDDFACVGAHGRIIRYRIHRR